MKKNITEVEDVRHDLRWIMCGSKVENKTIFFFTLRIF